MAYAVRAAAYGALGQPTRTLLDLEEVIRLKPRDAKAYFDRALAYLAFGRDEEAQRDVDRAAELGGVTELQ